MKSARSIDVTYERKLKIRMPQFKMSENIRYLDSNKLNKGSHTIELGKFDDCGCDCEVKAKVENGLITSIIHPRCKDARPMPGNVSKKMAAAYKELVSNIRPNWEDTPIDDLINGGAVGRMTDIIVTDGCFMVCWDEGRGEECVICCFEPNDHWCIGPSEPALHW